MAIRETASNEAPRQRQHATYWLVLAGLVLAHVAVNSAWITLDESLRSYDGGPHLEAHIQAVRVLRQQGLGGLAALVRPEHPGWWPSAGYLPASLLALIFGEGFDRMRAYYLLYLALLLISVAQTGRLLHSRGAGLLAATLVGLLPVVYSEGRNHGVDMPGAAMLSAAVWLLLTTHGFTRPLRCLGLGLVLGCGILVRPQLALFFTPVAVSVLVLGPGRSAAPETTRWRPLAGALLVAAVALATASPWWLGHLEEIARDFARHQQDAARLTGNAESNLAFYLARLPWAFSVWLLPGLLVSLWGWLRKPSPAQGRCHKLWPVLWVWLLGGTLLTLGIKVHVMRFLLPLCPALALVTAVGILRIPRPYVRRALAALLILVAGGFWLVDSFWREIRPDRLLPAPLVSPRPHGLCSGPPHQDPGILALDRLGRGLAERHPRGRGLVLKMMETPASGRLRWCGGPVLRLALPEASVDGQSYKGRYFFHDRAYVKIGGTVMPPLAYSTRNSVLHVVTFEERPPASEAFIFGASRQLVLQVPIHGGPLRWAAVWR